MVTITESTENKVLEATEPRGLDDGLGSNNPIFKLDNGNDRVTTREELAHLIKETKEYYSNLSGDLKEKIVKDFNNNFEGKSGQKLADALYKRTGIKFTPDAAEDFVQAMRDGATSPSQAEAVKQSDAQTSREMQKNLSDDQKNKKVEEKGQKAEVAEQKDSFLMALVKMVLGALGINIGSEEGQNVKKDVKAQNVGKDISASTAIDTVQNEALQSAARVTGDKFGGLSREALEAAISAGEGARNAGTRSSNTEQYQYAGAAQPQQQTASAAR